MSFQHKQLAAGGWFKLTLVEQMAHIGSEVIRALAWKQKGDQNYTRMAFERALELLDLTRADPKCRHRLKEICRVREVLCDYFAGDNEYGSTGDQWRNYFNAFGWASRKNH